MLSSSFQESEIRSHARLLYRPSELDNQQLIAECLHILRPIVHCIFSLLLSFNFTLYPSIVMVIYLYIVSFHCVVI